MTDQVEAFGAASPKDPKDTGRYTVDDMTDDASPKSTDVGGQRRYYNEDRGDSPHARRTSTASSERSATSDSEQDQARAEWKERNQGASMRRRSSLVSSSLFGLLSDDISTQPGSPLAAPPGPEREQKQSEAKLSRHNSDPFPLIGALMGSPGAKDGKKRHRQSPASPKRRMRNTRQSTFLQYYFTESQGSLVVHPESILCCLVEAAYSAAAVLDYLWIAFAIAFARPSSLAGYAPLALIDAFFLFDFALHFATAYYNDTEKLRLLVVDWRKILPHYVWGGGGRWWLPAQGFVVDVATLAPLDWAAMARGTPLTSRLLPLLRLPKVARLWRMTQKDLVLRTLEYSQKTTPTVVRVFKLLGTILLIVHTVAAGFMLAADDCAEDQYFAGVREQYMCALYWSVSALTTSGSVSLDANNAMEWPFWTRMYVTVAMLGGAVVVSFVVGSIGSVIANYDMPAVRFKQRMDEVNALMQHRHIPRDLQKRIQDYMYYVYRRNKGYSEDHILHSLSRPLQTEYRITTLRSLLQELPFFQRYSNAMLERLVNCMTLTFFAPADVIFHEGDVGDELAIISKGKVEIVKGAERGREARLAVLSTGAFMGEICILGVNTRRSATARCLTYTDLYLLSHDDVQKVIAVDSNFEATLMTEAEDRIKDQADSAEERRAAVQAVPLFAPFTNPDLIADLADGLEVRTVLANDWVYTAGDPGDCMFIIKSGRLDVYKVKDGVPQTAEALIEMGPGSCLHEMSVLLEGEHQNSVKAVELSVLYCLSRDVFRGILNGGQYPEESESLGGVSRQRRISLALTSPVAYTDEERRMLDRLSKDDGGGLRQNSRTQRSKSMFPTRAAAGSRTRASMAPSDANLQELRDSFRSGFAASPGDSFRREAAAEQQSKRGAASALGGSLPLSPALPLQEAGPPLQEAGPAAEAGAPAAGLAAPAPPRSHAAERLKVVEQHLLPMYTMYAAAAESRFEPSGPPPPPVRTPKVSFTGPPPASDSSASASEQSAPSTVPATTKGGAGARGRQVSTYAAVSRRDSMNRRESVEDLQRAVAAGLHDDDDGGGRAREAPGARVCHPGLVPEAPGGGGAGTGDEAAAAAESGRASSGGGASGGGPAPSTWVSPEHLATMQEEMGVMLQLYRLHLSGYRMLQAPEPAPLRPSTLHTLLSSDLP